MDDACNIAGRIEIAIFGDMSPNEGLSLGTAKQACGVGGSVEDQFPCSEASSLQNQNNLDDDPQSNGDGEPSIIVLENKAPALFRKRKRWGGIMSIFIRRSGRGALDEAVVEVLDKRGAARRARARRRSRSSIKNPHLIGVEIKERLRSLADAQGRGLLERNQVDDLANWLHIRAYNVATQPRFFERRGVTPAVNDFDLDISLGQHSASVESPNQVDQPKFVINGYFFNEAALSPVLTSDEFIERFRQSFRQELLGFLQEHAIAIKENMSSATEHREPSF